MAADLRSRNMQYLKIRNHGDVLRTLAFRGISSRTELADELHLTRMAVGNIVADLMDRSIVEELENPSEDSGRKGGRRKLLRIKAWSIAAAGIWITRGVVHGMLMDLGGNVCENTSLPIPSGCGNDLLMELIGALLDKMMEAHRDLQILGIGVASIGPLDIYRGNILTPPDFGTIRDLDITRQLSARFGLPVYLENDMNCSALAEQFYGSGRGCRDIVFIGLAHGVGAGVTMNEKILHGAEGFAGEVGHISINPYGPRCTCGQRGCIELYTSGDHILHNTGTRSLRELSDLLDTDRTPGYILKSVEEYLRAMDTLVTTVANIYDPEIVILENEPYSMQNRYRQELEDYANAHMLYHGYKHMRVINGALSIPALYGAGYLVFQHVIDGSAGDLF